VGCEERCAGARELQRRDKGMVSRGRLLCGRRARDAGRPAASVHL